MARDGGHPSTDFSRAVEEVFTILEIKAEFRGPAKWAIDQLKDDDFTPEDLVADLQKLKSNKTPQELFESLMAFGKKMGLKKPIPPE